MPPRSTELIARRSALDRGLIADRSPDNEIAAMGLRRMRVLVDHLGNPRDQFRSIHIAGSKGKGTTTYIAAALLAAHGYRTGRYTSPHLQSWNERIAIDDSTIPEDQLARLLALIDSEMSRLEREEADLGKYNAFELMTAAALLYFAERNVDFAALEVGLGGRFDSTNVVQATVSVITRIELEHEEVLGPGLRTIAWNKAGIVTTNAPVVVARQVPDALTVIEEEAAESAAPIYLEDRDWALEPTGADLTFRFGEFALDELSLNLPGTHNLSNAGAALTAVSLALKPAALEPATTLSTLAGIRIPGRYERTEAGVPPRAWVLDVAHSRESIARLLEAAADDPALDGFAVIFALFDDKPAAAMIETISRRTDVLILPEIHHPRAIPADRLAEVSSQMSIETHVAPDVDSAVALATSLDRPVVVTGSFALVGQVRATLVENGNPTS